MNEPLRDRDLGGKIKYIAEKRNSNNFSIKVNTNASFLEGDMVESLLNSGLDRLNISFHGISKEVYEKSMKGLNYERVLANVNNFLETKKKKGVEKPKVTITMVKTMWVEAEIDDVRSYWDERAIGYHIQPLENRANEQVKHKGLNTNEWHPYLWCKRLFTQAYILYNGDVVLCCVDWERTTVLGNVKEKSIEEVWNGERAVSIRRKFLDGDMKGLLCHSCLRQHRQ
jgi:MoaA/NifB/PqqE/SkfB family radical SAM enzyme